MRRSALRSVVALLAVLALPAAARAGDGGAHTFERGVSARASSSAHWRTPPLRAARRFQLVGATWRGPRGSVQLRARRTDGSWTRWAAAEAGEPIWSGTATAVQLRGARPRRGLRLRFVSVGRGVAPAAPRALPAAADGRPAIVPRNAWDPHHTCHPRAPARYGRVDFAIVHHTESLSLYSPAQSAAIVLGICLFHRDGNGWNDIGYDLLVDRYGTIFEGRAGGVEQPVIGAQAGGWNAVSTGVAMIGGYALEQPPAAALRALERGLAWKLSLAGVPASDSIVERSTGGDPADNAHPRGALVRFQRIAGHRDADFTDCPGAALYALLPQVRRAVAALLPAPRDRLTLSPVGAPIEQAPWELSGRLALANGRRPAGVAIELQQQGADGGWQQVAATRTGADGIWSAAPTLTVDGPLRAVAPSVAPGLASQVVQVAVRTGVRLRLSALHPRAGGTLRISGATTPPKARVLVRVERQASGGAFRPALARRIATGAGRFDLPVRLVRPGVYRVLVTTRADAANAAGGSRIAVVRVLRRR
jgi:hypothetical protein